MDVFLESLGIILGSENMKRNPNRGREKCFTVFYRSTVSGDINRVVERITYFTYFSGATATCGPSALACSRILIQRCLSFAMLCQFLIPSVRRSCSTPPIHRIFGRPIPLLPSGSLRNNIEGALFLSMRAKCPAHHILWTFTSATISGSPKSRFSSKLYRRRHLSPSIIVPIMGRSTLRLNVRSNCSSLFFTVQDSHP